MQYHSDISDANFPTDAEGRTYHLDVKKGEVAPRIVTCGDLGRLLIFIKSPGFQLKFIHQSPRLFTIATGLYKNKPVSIITSLMGFANTDFTVIESRYCVKGPMAMIRVGTCGSPDENVKVGDICVPNELRSVWRIPDAIKKGKTELKDIYYISEPFQADKQLAKLLQDQVKEKFGIVHQGDHISCDSFYSTQGRQTGLFDDKNEGLIEYYLQKLPKLQSIEMETSLMCDLAERSYEKMYCCGAHIVVAQRKSNEFLTLQKKHEIESKIAICALEAVTQMEVKDIIEQYDGAVWMNDKVTGDEELIKQTQ